MRQLGKPRCRGVLKWVFEKWDGETWNGLICYRVRSSKGAC